MICSNQAWRKKRKTCLEPSSAQLFDSDIDLLTWVFHASDYSPVHTTKSTLSNHDRAAEILCRCLQFWECEDSKIALSLRQSSKWVLCGRVCAKIWYILRIELRPRFPQVTISWHRRWCRRSGSGRTDLVTSLWFFIFLFIREVKTLHSS